MERKLIDYLPYVIRDYAEFQGIMGSEQPEIEKRSEEHTSEL